jgi:hypothetical protein
VGIRRPSGRRLLAKLVPTFADRGCHVVSATIPAAVNLSFLDRSRYFFVQVAPQLSSRGWVDPVPDPLLLRKSGSAGVEPGTSGSVARNSLADYKPRSFSTRRGMDWIYWPHVHITLNYRRQLTALVLSPHFTGHRYTHTSVLSLHWSYPGNGFQHSNYTSLTVTAAHTKSSLHSPNSFFSIIFDSYLKRLPHFWFQSYFTTGLPPVSSYWRQALWNSWPVNFFFPTEHLLS